MHFSKHRRNKTHPDDLVETARKQRDTDSREAEYDGKLVNRTVYYC